jgi:hypothetical protein
MIRSLPARLPVPDTSDVCAEKCFLILHLAQERLQRIARIYDAARPEVLIDDRDMDKVSQMHERQNVMQRVRLLTVSHSGSHYVRNSDVAQIAMVTSDLSHDVRLCNDTRHRPFAVTDDEEVPYVCCIAASRPL